MFGVTERANKFLNIYSVYGQTLIIQSDMCHAIFPPLGLIAVVQKIIQDILDIFNDILDTIENITADTVEWAQNIDFSPLITSFENVTSALKPLTADIFDGIEWFWDNILLPMASWTISTLIPTFLNLLAAAIKVLDSAISALKPMGKWLWDKFFEAYCNMDRRYYSRRVERYYISLKWG